MEETNNQSEVDLRTRLLGITTEVGGGIATDWATGGLLFGGPAGWAAYGLINFGQGAYTNYLVQKHLYGNENINWGEVIASGGMGIIPFMDIKAGKYAKLLGKSNTVQRGIVGGALTGLAGEQVRVGIDEQRFLNPLEAVTAAGVGGTFGGGLTAVSKGIKGRQINQLQEGKNILGKPLRTRPPIPGGLQEQFSPNLKARMMAQINGDNIQTNQYDQLSFDFTKPVVDTKQTTLIPKFTQELQSPSPTIASDMMKRAINNNLVIEGTNRLDFKKLLQSPTFAPGYNRLIAGDIATPPTKGLPYSKITRRTIYQNRMYAFNKLRDEKLKVFKSVFGEDLTRLNLKESDLDLDHRLTLVQSLGMLHNTNPGDDLWRRITKYALDRGYTPGDARANLALIDPESHRVKSRFFNKLHGLSPKNKKTNNLKYWNGQHRDSGKTRLQIMEESHLSDEAADLHMEVVKDYFDLVDRGDNILNTAVTLFEVNNKKGILPEEIVDKLMPLILDEDIQYNTNQIKDIIKQILADAQIKINRARKIIELEDEIATYESNIPYGAEDVDPADIIEAKKQLKKLKTVRKPKLSARILREEFNRILRERDDPQLKIPGLERQILNE